MPDVLVVIPAPPVVLPIALVTLLAVFVLRRTGDKLRLVASLGLVVYGAALVSLTFFPLQIGLGAYGSHGPWYGSLNWIPIETIDQRTFLLNIMLTIPLGILVPLATRFASVPSVILVGFVVSVLIETLQLATNVLLNSGRLADVNDVIANTLGAAIGVVVVAAVRGLGGRRTVQGATGP